jgi:hypothetical protein
MIHGARFGGAFVFRSQNLRLSAGVNGSNAIQVTTLIYKCLEA